MNRYRMMAAGGLIVAGAALLAQTSAQKPAPAEKAAPVAKVEGETAPPAMTMFGHDRTRNMVNLTDKGIPDKFSLEEDVLWKAQLGSRAYGGPTVWDGKVFVGTNNENPRNDRDRAKAGPDEEKGIPIDKGVLMAFDEKDGKFSWQAIHDKLPSGPVHDWPREGVCATPAAEGDRIYYVSNRCTLVCATTKGLGAGNVGFDKEKYQTKTDEDVVWQFDMMKELGVSPHNMSACSPFDHRRYCLRRDRQRRGRGAHQPALARRPVVHRAGQEHGQAQVAVERARPANHARPMVEPGLCRGRR